MNRWMEWNGFYVIHFHFKLINWFDLVPGFEANNNCGKFERSRFRKYLYGWKFFCSSWKPVNNNMEQQNGLSKWSMYILLKLFMDVIANFIKVFFCRWPLYSVYADSVCSTFFFVWFDVQCGWWVHYTLSLTTQNEKWTEFQHSDLCHVPATEIIDTCCSIIKYHDEEKTWIRSQRYRWNDSGTICHTQTKYSLILLNTYFVFNGFVRSIGLKCVWGFLRRHQ